MNCKYKVEKNVPMPHEQGLYDTLGRPFGKLKRGDSILFPLAEAKAASIASGRWSKAHNVKFMGRTQKDGFRIWRVS
jgi:hypothetical protein